MIFNKFGDFFSTIIFQMFLMSILFLFWNCRYTYVGRPDAVPPVCVALFIFLQIFYFSSSNWMISIGLSSGSLILLPSQNCYWVPLVKSSFQLYVSIPEFPFKKKKILIILLKFSLVTIIMFSFNSWNMVSFSSLNLFILVALKPRYAKSNI